MIKICPLCGNSFEGNKVTKYCKNKHYRKCEICGKEFEISLKYVNRETCSNECGRVLRKNKAVKTSLEKYGVANAGYTKESQEKIKKTNLEKYGVEYSFQSPIVQEKIKQTHINRYGVDNPQKCCEIRQKTELTNLKRYGDTCVLGKNSTLYNSILENNLKKYGVKNLGYTEESQRKIRETNIKRYGVPYCQQNPDIRRKTEKTFLKKYGVTSPLKSKHIQDKIKTTNIKKYGYVSPMKNDYVKSKMMENNLEKFGCKWYPETEEFKHKVKETCIAKYGVENISQLRETQDKIRQGCLDKYGVDSYIKVPEIRKKIARNSTNKSSLEIRLINILNEYNIEYISQYVISKDGMTHAFDFYLPKYKILIDCDGVYYHSYITDPNGKQSREDYDDVRLYLVSKDLYFFLLVESNFEQDLTRLIKSIEHIDSNIFDYDTEIFKWCREVGFPYPEYSDDRLIKEWNNLKRYKIDKYNPYCNIGISIIRQFHKSLWDCKVGNNKSVKEAWNDDILLKRVIKNRLIYQNTVNPSKVLTGFNVSKIAPKVSIFSPITAKYLINKYLNDYDEIFDPFSGFSGRLLGAMASGKKYIGQDIRKESVKESSLIIDFLDLDSNIKVRNILESQGNYECLFTCPPYSDKELYIENQKINTCDSWIDECIKRFNCKCYLFVVDNTEKYKSNIVEELEYSSHFRSNTEKVILIYKS